MFLLALELLMRTPTRFDHRVVIIVDAEAVMGAAATRRTSAPGIRGIIKRVRALLL